MPEVTAQPGPARSIGQAPPCIAGFARQRPILRIRRHGIRIAQVVAFLVCANPASVYNVAVGVSRQPGRFEPSVPHH
jgi:hypothetical protein